MLKYVLLGTLNYLPLTGYQLKQFFDRSTQHFWYAQTSQIYRTLNKLEEEGLVTSKIEAQEDHPDRRLYQLTDAGRRDLQHWLRQPMTEVEATKDTLLVRLFFSAQLDKATILTHLRLQRALHQQKLDAYQREISQDIESGVHERPELRRDALLWDATRRNGEIMEEAYIRWLDETIRHIDEAFES